MAHVSQELNERFAAPNEELSPEIQTEMQSILRIHDLPVDELSYKWESYCMKMGGETKLDLKTARDFKKDLQEILERETRSKASKGSEKRTVAATPRPSMGGGGAYDMLDSLVTPGPGRASITKRKANFESPAPKAAKTHLTSSPTNAKPATSSRSFADREKAGEIDEALNSHIEYPAVPTTMPSESRIKLKANTDLTKFGYKTMAMKLSEAAEFFDDRIEEFMAIVQEHHNLDDSDLGNPARASQNEIVAVGRIASDSQDGRLNLASMVLETSRRMGGGIRVPLKLDQRLQSFDFFSGRIVALRGINARGEYFTVTEILDLPLLLHAGSSASHLDLANSRLQQEDGTEQPLTVLAASGPYTTENSLDFSAFDSLLSKAQDLRVDGLILSGPFIDIEHSIVREGDFDLPSDFPVEPDQATITDLFRYHISLPLQRLAKAVPSISIIMCPSLRDAVSRHAAWPQDKFQKKDLHLPRQVSVVTNPITISLNETMLGMSSLDVLDQLRATGVHGGKATHEDFLARLSKNVLEQRHYFPIIPPTDRQSLSAMPTEVKGMDAEDLTLGASLDISYGKLGEMRDRPDVLVLPSTLKPFAKIVEGVVAVNPGTLSRRRAPGTYARMTILPRIINDEERESGNLLTHNLHERMRVDIVRI